MFDHPLSFQGVYSSIICQFSQQNAKKGLACPLAKNTTASLKNRRVYAVCAFLQLCDEDDDDNDDNNDNGWYQWEAGKQYCNLRSPARTQPLTTNVCPTV